LLNSLGFSREALSAARRGLADGSFRRVDVTPHVRDAFNHVTESALDVYYILQMTNKFLHLHLHCFFLSLLMPASYFACLPGLIDEYHAH
jgi:hypothetical protein